MINKYEYLNYEAAVTNKFKIIKVVKFNDHEALVLNKAPEFVFERFDNTLVGRDGMFIRLYKYERPTERWKAFGGTEFDLKMRDGSIEHCYGQWWDGITDRAFKELGIESRNEICSPTYGTVTALEKCYVFTSGYALQRDYDQFRATYKERVLEYWEYESELKGKSTSRWPK